MEVRFDAHRPHSQPNPSFHELEPGEHRIHVMLVGNDHKPLGPEEVVTVLIPTAVLAH